MDLAGYHLPLDAHPELGNNASAGQADGLGETDYACGEQNLLILAAPIK